MSRRSEGRRRRGMKCLGAPDTVVKGTASVYLYIVLTLFQGHSV